MLKCLSIPQIPDFKRVSLNKATTQGDLYLKGKGEKIKQSVFILIFIVMYKKNNMF